MEFGVNFSEFRLFLVGCGGNLELERDIQRVTKDNLG